MKSLQEQYNLISEGKWNKDIFLRESKRMYPHLIRNSSGFNEVVKTLKHNHLLFENKSSNNNSKEIDFFKSFKSFINENKAIEKKTTKEVEDLQSKAYNNKDKTNIDNIFGTEFLQGFYTEMGDPKNEKKSVEDLKKIVTKNLAKDPLFYVKDGQFGVKGIGYEDDTPGLKSSPELKGKWKSSGYGDLDKKSKENLKESILKILKETSQGGKYLEEGIHDRDITSAPHTNLKPPTPSSPEQLDKMNVERILYNHRYKSKIQHLLDKHNISIGEFRRMAKVDQLNSKELQDLDYVEDRIMAHLSDREGYGNRGNSLSQGFKDEDEKENYYLDLDDVNESMSYSTQKEMERLVKILGVQNFKKAAQTFASGSRTPKELYKNFMGKMDLADEGRLEDKIVRSSYETVDFFLERLIYFLENYYKEKGRDINESSDDDVLLFSNGETTLELYKSGDEWREGDVYGETPYGWGSKTYMSYLSPNDIISYLRDDYGGHWKRVTHKLDSVNESNEFGGVGLLVYGRTIKDNHLIDQVTEETGLYGIFNAHEDYWFFPEKEETIDALENQLETAFIKKGINARFEAQLNEIISESRKGEVDLHDYEDMVDYLLADLDWCAKNKVHTHQELKNKFDPNEVRREATKMATRNNDLNEDSNLIRESNPKLKIGDKITIENDDEDGDFNAGEYKVVALPKGMVRLKGMGTSILVTQGALNQVGYTLNENKRNMTKLISLLENEDSNVVRESNSKFKVGDEVQTIDHLNRWSNPKIINKVIPTKDGTKYDILFQGYPEDNWRIHSRVPESQIRFYTGNDHKFKDAYNKREQRKRELGTRGKPSNPYGPKSPFKEKVDENKNSMLKLIDLLEGEDRYYKQSPKKETSKKTTKKKKPQVKDKIKDIEEQGNIAALEAKIGALDEEINKRNAKIDMVAENDDLSDFVNPARIKEMKKDIQELVKTKEGYEKKYEKLTGNPYIAKKEEIVGEDIEGLDRTRELKESIKKIFEN